jgi:hypothetical protein
MSGGDLNACPLAEFDELLTEQPRGCGSLSHFRICVIETLLRQRRGRFPLLPTARGSQGQARNRSLPTETYTGRNKTGTKKGAPLCVDIGLGAITEVLLIVGISRSSYQSDSMVFET